jgi:hypothetical protein
MTKEDKILLVQDLSARLPYGVQIKYRDNFITTLHNMIVHPLYNNDDSIKDYVCLIDIYGDGSYVDIENVKPILYPLYHIPETNKDCQTLLKIVHEDELPLNESIEVIQFAYKNQYDFRGLIEKGLAIDGSTLFK